MTTPAERTRELRLASEFLREIQRSTDGDPELRLQATVIRRHYPSSDEIAQWARIGSLKVPTWK